MKSVRSSLLFFAVGAMTTTASAQTAQVLVGWNDFDGTVGVAETNPEAATEAATGFSGFLNGGQNEGGEGDEFNMNIGNDSYGDTGFTFTLDPASKGLRMASWNNNIRRVDFSVTNNSGAEVSLGYIAFDLQMNFYSGVNPGANTTTVTLMHSPVASGFFQSDLAVPGGTTIATIEIREAVEAFDWLQLTFPLTDLADFTLADGETASFRFEVPSSADDNPARGGFKLDNLAFISAGELPEVTVTWAGFEVDEDGWADTGDWLGWVFTGNAPWLYNLSLDAWFFMNEDNIAETGAWAYVVK